MGVDKQQHKQKQKQKPFDFEKLDEETQHKKAKRKKRMADHADRDRREPGARRMQTPVKRRMREISADDDYEAAYDIRHVNRKSRKDD
jgi:hypothetical protein